MNPFGLSSAPRDYSKFLTGFNPEEILQKATVTNQYAGTDPFAEPNFSIGAFQVEDLQPLLTIQTAQLRELKLWRRLYKDPKQNLVWQYNKETAVGSDRISSFVGEGGVGAQEGSTQERVSRIIKFMSEWGMVSLQAQMLKLGGITNPRADLQAQTMMARETNNRIKHLLFQNERLMFYSNADILGTNSYNGIVQQMVNEADDDPLVANQIIDLHGGPLSREAIELGTQQAVDNHLVVREDNVVLMAPTSVFAGYALTLSDKERLQIALNGQGDRRILTGTPVAGHVTQYGPVQFEHNVFMTRIPTRDGVPAADRGSPSATLGSPATVVPTNTGANAESAFYTEDAATLYYTVTSIDYGGENTTGTTSAGVPVAFGEAISVAIADPGSGDTPKGYRIYRGTLSSGADKKFVAEIARTGASTVYTDTNYWMPGTDIAVQFDFEPDVLEYAQLGPLMRMNLPFFGLAHAFAVFLFGDIAVKDPRKMVIYRNIGRLGDNYLESLQET